MNNRKSILCLFLLFLPPAHNGFITVNAHEQSANLLKEVITLKTVLKARKNTLKLHQTEKQDCQKFYLLDLVKL